MGDDEKYMLNAILQDKMVDGIEEDLTRKKVPPKRPVKREHTPIKERESRRRYEEKIMKAAKVVILEGGNIEEMDEGDS